MAPKVLSGVRAAALLCCALAGVAVAQVSGGPSANCHATDGIFTACANGQTEWSDVQPVFFPGSNSYLYVNQDPKHTFLYLMYDFPARTTNLAPAESVHINFATVETGSGGPALVFYDVFIPASGPISVLENGQPTPAGSFVGGAGFGTSPNSSTPHVTAELQVPLGPGLPPGVYSPDPIFWGAAPPTPTPTPSPSPSPTPTPCPTDPGKTYNNCVKRELANAQANAANIAAVLATGGGFCSTIGALGCAPLEPGFLALALACQIASNEFGRKLALDPPGIDFGLPPEPNFTEIAQ